MRKKLFHFLIFLLLPLAAYSSDNYTISKKYKRLHRLSVISFPISRKLSFYYNNMVLAHYPNFVPALSVKYSILLMNEDFEEALKVADKLIELEPTVIEYRVDKLMCLMKMERWDEYDKELEELYTKNPDNFELTWHRMIGARMKGDICEASKYARKLLSLAPPEDDPLASKRIKGAEKIIQQSASCINKRENLIEQRP